MLEEVFYHKNKTHCVNHVVLVVLMIIAIIIIVVAMVIIVWNNIKKCTVINIIIVRETNNYELIIIKLTITILQHLLMCILPSIRQ